MKNVKAHKIVEWWKNFGKCKIYYRFVEQDVELLVEYDNIFFKYYCTRNKVTVRIGQSQYEGTVDDVLKYTEEFLLTRKTRKGTRIRHPKIKLNDEIKMGTASRIRYGVNRSQRARLRRGE